MSHGIQWVKCCLGIQSTVGVCNGTVCMVPFCSRRVADPVLLHGTYMSATRKKSLQQLVDDGMPFVLHSACCTCQKWKVPFFLRDVQVEGLYFCPNNHEAKHMVRCKTHQPRQHPSEQQEGTWFHAYKEPSFENICGSVFLPYLMPVEDGIPPLQDARVLRRSSKGSKAKQRSKRKRGSSALNRKKGSEIFTVHGNLCLRKRTYGTSINFKVHFSASLSCLQ